MKNSLQQQQQQQQQHDDNYDDDEDDKDKGDDDNEDDNDDDGDDDDDTRDFGYSKEMYFLCRVPTPSLPEPSSVPRCWRAAFYRRMFFRPSIRPTTIMHYGPEWKKNTE